MWLAVALTLLPFLFKAVRYALIGSYVPLLLFAAIVAMLLGGLTLGGSWERRSIRLWTTGMVLWSFARLVVLGMVKIAGPGGIGAQMRSDLSPTFALVSVACLVAGIVIWRAAAATAASRAARVGR